MAKSHPITIVGGGLAGLTLGIGLRQHDVPVTIREAGSYPRHRVCGEFISGRGLAILDRFGLLAPLRTAPSFLAGTALFAADPNRSPVRRLPDPALCISRHDLDHLLAREFERLGGVLRQNAQWKDPAAQERVVWAAGRRRQASEDGWRWFGLKAHARNVNLEADLEMHVCRRGYVGVNRINDCEVNICGLFRSRPGDSDAAGIHRLRGDGGSLLEARLRDAEFDPDSFCSVAGLSLKPRRAAGRNECVIGDSLTMIPPATGNGMSMAFESAGLALEPLIACCRGELDWGRARRAIAQACDAAFAKRLLWARWLQCLMLVPVLRTPPGALLLRSNFLWELLFSRTR